MDSKIKIKVLNEPSAPSEEEVVVDSFKRSLYPQIPKMEFNSNNYKINRIMHHYKYLDEERKLRNSLKKKYIKISKVAHGTEVIAVTAEISTVVTSMFVPILIPLNVPLSLGLTTFNALIRTTENYILRKINKHNAIELLCKSKINSIETKYVKAISDGQITDDEFNDIEQEIKNYESLKEKLLNDFKNKKQQLVIKDNLTDELKLSLLEQGKTLGRSEVFEKLKKDLKM